MHLVFENYFLSLISEKYVSIFHTPENLDPSWLCAIFEGFPTGYLWCGGLKTHQHNLVQPFQGGEVGVGFGRGGVTVACPLAR